MARPFVFPDPDDCSPNSPTIIVNPAQVLGLYNQETGEQMQRVTSKVTEWLCETAKKKHGWGEAAVSGNQCILTASFKS